MAFFWAPVIYDKIRRAALPTDVIMSLPEDVIYDETCRAVLRSDVIVSLPIPEVQILIGCQ